MSNHPTIEEFKQAIHKFDLQIRPNIIFLNPADAEYIKSVLPKIEEEIVIQTSEIVEEGKMYVMNRKDLEAWTFGKEVEE